MNPADLSKRQQQELRDRSLLDPASALATVAQRRVLETLLTTEGYEDLAKDVRATTVVHRQIMTQLIAGAMSRGLNGRLTGVQRATFATEAWSIIHASDLFVKDRIAAAEIDADDAESVLNAAQAPADDMPEPSTLALVPDAPRPQFDALGNVTNAPEAP